MTAKIVVSFRKEDCNKDLGENVCAMVDGKKLEGLESVESVNGILKVTFIQGSFDIEWDKQ